MQFRLKEIMMEKSISNVDLAKMLNYTTVAISNMVTGKTLPAIKTLERISELTGIPVWQFFADEEKVRKDLGLEQKANPNEIHATCPHCGKDITIEINLK